MNEARVGDHGYAHLGQSMVYGYVIDCDDTQVTIRTYQQKTAGGFKLYAMDGWKWKTEVPEERHAWIYKHHWGWVCTKCSEVCVTLSKEDLKHEDGELFKGYWIDPCKNHGRCGI